MKPLFIKKNGTVSKISGIVMNLIPSYTLAEYNALTHKPLFWVRTDEEYAQISSEDVSYGNSTVKEELDELNAKIVNAGTVRYNEITDRFEVLKNGEWVESIKAYANNLILFDGTSFYAPYENGVYNPDSSTFTIIGGFTVNLPSFVANAVTTNYQGRSFAFSNAIDFTQYSSLIVETTGGTVTVDVSSINQNAYIFIDTLKIDNSNYFTVRVCNAKQTNYALSSVLLTQDRIVNGTASNDLAITNIRVVK